MAGIELNGTVKDTIKQVPGMVALIVVVIAFLKFMGAQSTMIQETQAVEKEADKILVERVINSVDANTRILGRVEKVMDDLAGD